MLIYVQSGGVHIAYQVLDGSERDSSQHVGSHRGRLRRRSPGSIIATFDAPGYAIRCAAALRDEAATHGLGIRAAIHTSVKDLAVGSGISFAGRGTRPLASADGRWQLFAVTAA